MISINRSVWRFCANNNFFAVCCRFIYYFVLWKSCVCVCWLALLGVVLFTWLHKETIARNWNWKKYGSANWSFLFVCWITLPELLRLIAFVIFLFYSVTQFQRWKKTMTLGKNTSILFNSMSENFAWNVSFGVVLWPWSLFNWAYMTGVGWVRGVLFLLFLV